jgi:hypothetical protein
LLKEAYIPEIMKHGSEAIICLHYKSKFQMEKTIGGSSRYSVGISFRRMDKISLVAEGINIGVSNKA